MPLIDKQISVILDQLIKQAIINGRLPSQEELRRKLTARANRVNGAPTFRPIQANRLSNFDVAKWNREIENCEFDIQILYKELISQAILLMRRTGWTDTTYRAQRGQLDRLIAALNDVLFAKQNAEDHFLGFSETFTDFSKIDLSNSTDGILSLAEKAILIPATATGTKRIKMEDKLRTTSPPIKVNNPSRNQVVRSYTAADAPFHHIFQDVSLIWRHDVIVKEDKGCEIQVTFPINDQAGAERITKAAITPNSESEMKCRILYSLDGQNYTVLPSHLDWLSLNQMATTTALDFEAITVRYIRIILRKEDADEIVDGGYRYSFGLRNFSLYEANRLPQATYQTIVMTPQFGNVERVAIETQDYIPGGCNIDYYVADETGEFLPITPIGQASQRAPRIIKFGDIRDDWTHFFASGEQIYSYNSVDYYRANPTSITGEYHFGLTKLFRGKDAWGRETSTIEETQTARDTFIQFTNNDQKMYTYKTASITGEVLTADDNTDRTVLTVPSGDAIYFDRNISGHLIRPPYGVDVENDEQPKYAVAEVLAIRSSYDVTGETHQLSKTQWTEFTNRNLDESDRPLVLLSSTDGGPYNPVAEDSGYKLEKWQGEGDYLTGRIKLLDSLPDSLVYSSINYTIRRNITHLVRDVDSTRGKIWLAHQINADRFVVRYRIVPNNIIRKSIVVTERRGEDQGELYKEGSDYIVNVGTGTISRPEGSKIPAGGSCYVDYQWVEEKYSLETYTTWCYYDRDEPAIIEFDTPTLDKDGGETFYMDVDGGRYDLSAATETPILTRGWHRFTCESKAIEQSGSAIRNVLALLDISGKPIFSGSEWFAEIRAFRSPMNEVSEAKLKFGTRSGDHSTFAIDPNGYIVLNFNPGNVDDITTLKYDPTTASLVEQSEFFELIRATSSGKTSKGVRLRIVLRRNPNVDPGTTPKVFRWALRLSR